MRSAAAPDGVFGSKIGGLEIAEDPGFGQSPFRTPHHFEIDGFRFFIVAEAIDKVASAPGVGQIAKAIFCVRP
jgi:hypothetical protein